MITGFEVVKFDKLFLHRFSKYKHKKKLTSNWLFSTALYRRSGGGATPPSVMALYWFGLLPHLTPRESLMRQMRRRARTAFMVAVQRWKERKLSQWEPGNSLLQNVRRKKGNYFLTAPSLEPYTRKGKILFYQVELHWGTSSFTRLISWETKLVPT